MTLKNFQDLYVSNLSHKTSVIKDQLESGMYLLKRVAFYIRKIATAKKSCSIELSKCSDHELEKKDRINKDRMHLHVNAYQQMQHVFTQMAFFDLKYGSDLLDRVAEPLLNWHKDAEVKLKKIMVAEEKLESNIAALRAKVKAERALCLKAWAELVKEYKEWQRSLSSGDSKKIEKLEKAFAAKRQKTQNTFQKFEAMCDAGNGELKTYWMKDLPALVTAYEQLEVERMNELESKLVEFAKIQSEYSQPFPGMLAMVDLAVKGINGPKELKGFVESAVTASGGKPEPPQNFVDGLPADSKSLGDSANPNLLGTLLNADPVQLQTQREAQQMKTAGNVLGADTIPSHAALTAQAAAASSSTSPHGGSSSSSSSSFASASAGGNVSQSSAAAAAAAAAAHEFDFSQDPNDTFVRALYDFTSEDVDDLTFTINTIIKVTLKGEDDELAAEVESGQADVNAEPRWWRGRRLENIGKSNDGTFPSNYVRVCGIDKEIALRHLLELPSGLKVFSEFLQTEFASENILFWMRVERFRNEAMTMLNDAGELREEGKPAMLRLAEDIAQEFIGNKAASQVNISSATLKMTQDRLTALPTSLSLNMFDEAASEIMKMMNADSYARFKRHPLFDHYLLAFANKKQ